MRAPRSDSDDAAWLGRSTDEDEVVAVSSYWRGDGTLAYRGYGAGGRLRTASDLAAVYPFLFSPKARGQRVADTETPGRAH